MTFTESMSVEVTVDSEAFQKSLAAALREMADKLDPPVVGHSGGLCPLHGGYFGARCPNCSKGSRG